MSSDRLGRNGTCPLRRRGRRRHCRSASTRLVSPSLPLGSYRARIELMSIFDQRGSTLGERLRTWMRMSRWRRARCGARTRRMQRSKAESQPRGQVSHDRASLTNHPHLYGGADTFFSLVVARAATVSAPFAPSADRRTARPVCKSLTNYPKVARADHCASMIARRM